MATLSNAAVLINPPAPPVRPYGLFDVAVGPLPLPRIEAMSGGIEYQPDTCGIARLWEMNCVPVTSKVFDTGVPTLTADPFAVYTSWLCGSLGYSPEEIRARLLTRLSLKEQRAVEQRLWQGGGGVDGIFTDAAEVTSLGQADCTTDAVRMLEQALADNGVVGGTIHARSGMSAYLASDHQIEHPRPNLMTTHLGTPLVFGQGYDGTGPSAAPADSEWMFATGRIVVWGSETIVPDIRETLNRTTNQWYAVAERVFMLTVECGIWGVTVNRECPS